MLRTIGKQLYFVVYITRHSDALSVLFLGLAAPLAPKSLEAAWVLKERFLVVSGCVLAWQLLVRPYSGWRAVCRYSHSRGLYRY